LGGRNFCPPAEAKPRRPARSEQNPAKKFFFLLEEKIGRAQNKKCEENFFFGVASVSERWRGGASQFRSK